MGAKRRRIPPPENFHVRVRRKRLKDCLAFILVEPFQVELVQISEKRDPLAFFGNRGQKPKRPPQGFGCTRGKCEE